MRYFLISILFTISVYTFAQNKGDKKFIKTYYKELQQNLSSHVNYFDSITNTPHLEIKGNPEEFYRFVIKKRMKCVMRRYKIDDQDRLLKSMSITNLGLEMFELMNQENL